MTSKTEGGPATTEKTVSGAAAAAETRAHSDVSGATTRARRGAFSGDYNAGHPIQPVPETERKRTR